MVGAFYGFRSYLVLLLIGLYWSYEAPLQLSVKLLRVFLSILLSSFVELIGRLMVMAWKIIWFAILAMEGSGPSLSRAYIFFILLYTQM